MSEADNYIDGFYAAGGTSLLFDNLPIGPFSVVVDVGGCQGFWSDNINQRYHPHLRILEPRADYANMLKVKFQDFSNVVVEEIALSDSNRYAAMSLLGERSTLLPVSQTGDACVVRCVSAIDYCKRFNLIDLMCLNVEGSEYDILETLFREPSTLARIRRFQIQFHSHVGMGSTLIPIPQYHRRREAIRAQLQEHYTEVFCHPYVWESWSRKE